MELCTSGMSAAEIIVMDNGCRRYRKNFNEVASKSGREGRNNYSFQISAMVVLLLLYKVYWKILDREAVE